MSKYVFGIISNQQRDKEISGILDKICGAFSNNAVQYHFLDDFDSTEDINKASINALLSINGTGIESWQHILKGDVPLIIWIMDSPIRYYTLLQSLSSKKNLILFTSSAQDLNFLRRKFPNIITKFLPVAYEPSNDFNDKERTLDILYFNPLMTDVEADNAEIKSALGADAYEIISKLIEFSLRNPEASLWQVFNYLSVVYNYDKNDFELYMDIDTKIGKHISNLKALKILKKLSKLNISIYGPPVWKKYITGNQQYVGEISQSEIRSLFYKYKIVFNIDAVNDILAVSDYSLEAISSQTLYITENNLQMQYYFPKNDFDIYYNPLDANEIANKITTYLHNYSSTVALRDKMTHLTVKNHNWQARINQFISLF